MTDTYEVGEVAWLLYSSDWPNDPTRLCTIISPARLFRRSYGADGRFAWTDFFLPQYRVLDESGEPWVVGAEWLRKRRPPQDWLKLCRLNDVPVEELA